MAGFVAITSVQNPQVKQARELSTPKGREASRAFLCDGEHMVLEALTACPQAVRRIFVEQGKQERYAALLQQAPQAAALLSVPQHVMAAITQVKAPQGIAAVVDLPRPAALSDLGEQVLLLDALQDPGNLGTLLRTLDAAGFAGCLLTPGCADPFAPKALRASMGSVFRAPLVFTEGAEETLLAVETLKNAGYALLAAELHGEPFYERGPLPKKLCLMIGNEGAGLSPALLAAATHRYRLPMAGGAESLNAAIAAAVMMYDLKNR